MLLNRSAVVALAAFSVALSGCRRVEEPTPHERLHTPPSATSTPPSATSTPSASASTPAAAPLPAPTQLLTLASSAYQASLFADDEAIEILTGTAAYRILPSKEPLMRTLDSSFAATVTRRSYVYWSKGALWSEARRAPNPTGPTKLCALDERPQRIVADIAGDQFALLTRFEGNRHAIAKIEDRRLKTLYISPGSIDALTMIGDALYFVERPGGPGFRIARVKLAGGGAIFTSNRTGRWPALLGGTRDLVYYDGARRRVLSVSPDLQQERTLANDFICSPLAVAKNVYCSTMEGIFELSAMGAPRQIVPVSRKLITNLAATSERLAFITDVGGQGQDRLAVYAVPLEKPNAAAAPR